MCVIWVQLIECLESWMLGHSSPPSRVLSQTLQVLPQNEVWSCKRVCGQVKISAQCALNKSFCPKPNFPAPQILAQAVWLMGLLVFSVPNFFCVHLYSVVPYHTHQTWWEHFLSDDLWPHCRTRIAPPSGLQDLPWLTEVSASLPGHPEGVLQGFPLQADAHLCGGIGKQYPSSSFILTGERDVFFFVVAVCIFLDQL